jgi:hypothetical protein
MKGFTKAQNAVVFDRSLSMGARLTHTALVHLAWQRRGDDESVGVYLPALDQIAEMIGCSRTALKGYVTELRLDGLVVTRRVRNQGMIYHVYTTAADGDREMDERKARAKNDPELGRNPSHHARVYKEGQDLSKDVGANAPTRAPRLVKVNGQDIALNTLAAETGVDIRGGRVTEAVAALTGRNGQRGIRDQFWTECVTYAEAHGITDRLDEVRDGFEPLLVRAIERKAARYRQAWGAEVALTPSALRKWWTDLERMGGKSNGMTADEIEALDRA